MSDLIPEPDAIVYAFDSPEFVVSVAPDLLGGAGFSPAFVVSVSVPPGEWPATILGSPALSFEGGGHDIRPTRTEYCLMGQRPRAAIEITETKHLKAIDTKGQTLYRLYFGLPTDTPTEFHLTMPSISYGDRAINLPRLHGRRVEAKGGLRLRPA